MSCQDVCVDMYFDAEIAFSHSETRRAAKPHTCCECKRVIAKGEPHEYMCGKCDGDFWSDRTCAECAEIRKAFVCGSWAVGELWNEIREQLFPTWDEMRAIDCLANLTTDAAIAKMRAEYAEFQEI